MISLIELKKENFFWSVEKSGARYLISLVVKSKDKKLCYNDLITFDNIKDCRLFISLAKDANSYITNPEAKG